MRFPEVSHLLQNACSGTEERGMDVRQWTETFASAGSRMGPVPFGRLGLCSQIKQGDVWTEGEELGPSQDTRWSEWVVRGRLLGRLSH